MQKVKTIVVALCLFAAFSIAFACGGESTTTTEKTTATPAPAAQTAASPAAPAGGETASKPSSATVTITATNYAFEPKDVTIEPGTTVIWKNQTGKHTTVADDGKTFESPVLATGQEFRHTFQSEGKYPFHCSLHEKDMKGTITVARK